jgi:glycine/D-amino acid oxidase-like deaminating enzyme
MKENFRKRIEEGNEFIRECPEQDQFKQFFNYEFGCGEINPVYIAHLETLLPVWRARLKKENLLIEEEFDIDKLVITDQLVAWHGKNGATIYADKIIFCDGPAGFTNPYFKQLPFAPNKGEALVLEIPGLPASNVYKKSMSLVPLATKDWFWIGSNYSWDFDNHEPTDSFRQQTEKNIQEWLKLPFRIIEHRAGIRPATLERRPFVGLHPHQSRIGILNGLGTKGCSLAPFFAKQLADHLIHHKPVMAEADIRRFQKILSLKAG